MNSTRVSSLIITFLIVVSIFMVYITSAEDSIDNIVTAEFNIDFLSGTSLEIEIIMYPQKLTTDKTYYAEEIKTSSEQELGAFRLLLFQMLERQLEETFKNADIINFGMPTFDGVKFNEILNVELTTAYFGLNDSVNTNDFINGVLDMGAIVNYTLNFQVEPGWNNTYMIGLGENLNFKRTTGTLDGDSIRWTVKNWDGNTSSVTAELELMMDEPTTPSLESEEMPLEFILDSKTGEKTRLTSNIYVKSADILIYKVIPSFIYNIKFMPSDGIRLLVNNGFITWDKFYEKTIGPLKEKIETTIEKSSFNQSLDIVFSWDNSTTTDCIIPYEPLNMDNEPSIKAIMTEDEVDLRIFEISSRALFGLINSGAKANLSEEDVNFGDGLNDIGFEYNITLLLPEGVYLDGEEVYTWNKSIPPSGDFKSDIKPNYNSEDKETFIEIEVEATDLNLLSFFTGKTELTFRLNSNEIRNYNITKLPTEFKLPKKVSLEYMNADAFRLCVEEKVFSENIVTDFLDNEKDRFESLLTQLLPGLRVRGNVNKDVFEVSIKDWDENISNMDFKTPVKTSSYAHSSYPVSFDLSFLPPGVDIPTKKFNFSGLPNQNVTYRMIFPHGLSIGASDPLNKADVKKTKDGRYYIEITFSASEPHITDVVVSCKMVPTALFIIGVFMPCIISLIITIILVLVIYFIRKKRKGRKIETTLKEEDIDDYEDEDYYVPPPPGSK